MKKPKEERNLRRNSKNNKLKNCLEYLKERFGIENSIFENFCFFEKNKEIWMANEQLCRFDIKNFVRKGVRIFRIFPKGIKITTVGIQLFGKYAKKNVYEIKSEEELKKYLRGEDLIVGELKNIEEGQVIIKYRKDFLGSGIYKNGKIKNQLPKGRRLFLYE